MRTNSTLVRIAFNCKALLLMITAIIFINTANAATKTWSGAGAGGAGTDFNTGSNWAGGIAPVIMLPHHYNYLFGCALFQLGKVLVEKRLCTRAICERKEGLVRSA